ncbi:MAG TPA: hypothetical protein DF712_06165 [Balneola sp.]|nr:hypothetical protein [Balneola sp.]
MTERNLQDRIPTGATGIKQKLSMLMNKNVFNTAVVLEFVSNPEEFLSAPFQGESSAQNKVGQTLVSAVQAATSAISGEGLGSLAGGSDEIKTMRDLYKNQRGGRQVRVPAYIDQMPRNSIIGLDITGGMGSNNISKPDVFFPFFSSHLAMPIKPGEQVWIFYDKVGGRTVGYWISRKHGNLYTEDPNFCHIPRQGLIKAYQKNQKADGNKASINLDTLKTFPDPRYEGALSKSLPPGMTYEQTSLGSESYIKEFTGEPVPRYPKLCGDLVLQGSNNSMIVLTNEIKKLKTASIQLVAGRSISKNNTFKNKRTKSGKAHEHEEINKMLEIEGKFPDLEEGKIDVMKDAASIIITEKEGGSVRIGNAAGAYIELKSNGDICIVPANNGLIKLGGEDAKDALVSNTAVSAAAGAAVGTPILIQSGGTVGTGSSQGKFASKILVK